MIKKYFFISLLALHIGLGNATETQRIPQFSNNKVSAWETIIYPANQGLTMHRHEHARVVVAFTDGTLKITNDKKQVHYLKLEKDKAYFLDKDTPGELHTDINIGTQPIRVMVIQLNN